MVAVPIKNGFEVASNPTPTPMKSASVSKDVFDTTMGLDDLGRGAIYDGKALQEMKEDKDKTVVMERATQFDDIALKTLHDPENGLYTKSGKAYLDAVASTMEELNKSKSGLMEGLDNDQQALAMPAFSAKMNNLNEDIYKNSAKQTQVYREQTLDNLMKVETQKALVNRNNAGAVKTSVANVNASIAATFGKQVDGEALKSMQQKATSSILENVLDGRIADKSLYAKDFFEMFKSQIDPEKHARFTELINNVDSDVRSRLFADEWIASGLSEDEAYEKAHAISDFDLRDATEAKVNQVYGKKRELENQQKRDTEDKVWSQLEKNPDLNLIPADLDHSTKEQMKNFCLSGGKSDDDANKYVDLFEMKLNNAGEFAKVDLNQYRGSLTKDQYQSFRTSQIEIQKHGYTSITPDDDAVAQVVSTFGGWNKPKTEVVASQMQNLIQEEERRNGLKYSEKELPVVEERIGKWLKYSKEGNTSFVLEQNKAKAGFYKGLANDAAYFKKVHGREPDQKEFQSLLYQRAAKAIQSHNSNTYKEVVNKTVAKPHETKEVTYFSDSYLPQLGKDLGIKITVVPGGRYNPKEKGYDSYHNVNGVSQAVDVSMSEHTLKDREKLFVAQLNNPLVKKIGTADKNLLAKYGNNAKVEDESNFDKNKGTNHVNHMHLTMNVEHGDGVIVANNSGAVRMKAPDGRVYNVPVAQVAQYEKIGGVKI